MCVARACRHRSAARRADALASRGRGDEVVARGALMQGCHAGLVGRVWRRPTFPCLGAQYHGRWWFSRPSSGWDRVLSRRHGHQTVSANPAQWACIGASARCKASARSAPRLRWCVPRDVPARARGSGSGVWGCAGVGPWRCSGGWLLCMAGLVRGLCPLEAGVWGGTSRSGD